MIIGAYCINVFCIAINVKLKRSKKRPCRFYSTRSIFIMILQTMFALNQFRNYARGFEIAACAVICVGSQN